MELVQNFRWFENGEVQDMVIAGGKVVWRGASGTGPTATLAKNLNGATIAPGFIDNHCHIIASGIDLGRLNLSGQDSHEAVLDALRDRNLSEPDGWLLAVQYDQNRYADGHLTRTELDRISTTRPILLRHFNGHASVANSAALQLANVTSDTPDPEGGAYRRDASGAPDGVLLEAAHERVWGFVPDPSVEGMADAIIRAGESMAGYGITIACDMQTGRPDLLSELKAYTLALEKGCPIDLRLVIQWGAMFGRRAAAPEVIREHIAAFEATGRGRVVGIKIFVDGAIGSATAAIYGAYEGAEPEHGTWSGQLMYAPEKLKAMTLTAHDAGHAVSVHAIGDYAADLVMDAFEATGEPSRHRIEHIMLMSDAQIERLAKIGCAATMQPEFLHRFGHAYLRNLGAERTAKLKRFRSVLDAGIPLSLSSDRPIVPGDPRLAIRTASHRPAGFDPTENLSPTEAIFAHTVEAANCLGDTGRFGTLQPGSDARYVLVDDLL
jgi:predicted amidohydrolase YtcJ